MKHNPKAGVAAAAMALILTSGCATITHDSVQDIRVETRMASGEQVDGADCELRNEHSEYKVTSPGAVSVRRSAGSLEITCRYPNLPDAQATATSRANAGMYGNILLGGVVGAIVDHKTGSAYTYPNWLQLVLGKVLSFDRAGEVDGQPTAPRVVGETSSDVVVSEKVTLDDLKDLMKTIR